MPINIPIEQQEAHLMKHAYLSDCNITFVKMYGYEDPEEMIGARFPQLFDNAEAANLENLRTFLKTNYKVIQIESCEIGKNGIRKYFLNDVVGVIEDNYLVRVWGMQEDVTLQKSESEPENSLEKQLTPQQLNVLRLTVEGKKIKEIAAELDISPKTVEYIRKRIKDEFDTESIPELVALAVKFGIEIKKN
jgi:DNA-binding CsgD family transcriptional regulator